MFSPNGTKKLLVTENSALIFEDGIIIVEHKQARAGKHTTEITVYHVIPCEIPMHVCDYSRDWGRLPERTTGKTYVSVSHADYMLGAGIKNVHIALHNASEHMKEANLSTTDVTIETPAGWHMTDTCVNGMVFSGCSVYPNPDGGSYDRSTRAQYQNMQEYVNHLTSNREIIEYHEPK